MIHLNSLLTLIFLVAFMFFSTTIIVKSQDNSAIIRGKVSVSETGEPAVGVNVGLQNTIYGAATDMEGYYKITGIKPGTYTLVFTAIGFKDERQTVKLNSGQTLVMDKALESRNLEMQEVEIVGRKAESYKVDYSFTATKVATPINEIPQSISVVSKEILDDQQAYRLGEVVKNVAGVNQFSHYNDFTMRGFRGGARLINGLRSEMNFFSMPITPNLERVEVIKGPASALFADANPGGTINMITKKPLPVAKQSISFAGGSYNTKRGGVDVTGPIGESGKIMYRFNGGYEKSNSFRDFQGNESFLIAPSISYVDDEKGTRFNIDFVYSEDDSKLDRGQPIFNSAEGLGSTPVSFTLSQPSDFYNVDNMQINTSFSQEINEVLSFNVSYMRFDVDTDLEEHRTTNRFIDETTIQMGFINRERIINTNSMSSYLVAEGNTGIVKHNALIGFDYSDNKSDRAQWFAGWDRSDTTAVQPRNFDLENPVWTEDNPVELYPQNFKSDFGRPTKFNTRGIYFQDQVSVGDWKALFSIRREFYNDVVPDGSGGTFTSEQKAWLPRLGLVYESDLKTNFYFSYATGFQPINASNNFPEFGGPFDPERSRLYEVGSKSTLFGGRLIATVSLYEIIKKNVLVNAFDTENPDLLEQRGRQRSRGIEVEASGSITANWNITANYAWNRNLIVESDDSAEIGEIAENAPRSQGGLWTKYEFGNGFLENFGMAGGFNFVTERNTFDPDLQLPAYTVADVAFTYDFGRANLNLNIDNVFDKTHWIGGYNFGRIFPGQPRTFLAKLTYDF